MGNYDELEVYYEQIQAYCLEYYKSTENKNVWEMANDLMDMEGLPMHCPPHHFIVPAVLLTACRKAQDDPVEYLEADLKEANVRAHNILGGFCGLYGTCGAAVGVGIFMSIFTETSPCSVGSWAWTNKATAKSLLAMSEINGPRCCKRNTYIALDEARNIINEYLEIDLEKPDRVVCKYFKNNKECKGKECPFFHPEEV